MKKTLLALVVVAAGLTSFGQGYFADSTGLHTIWTTNGTGGYTYSSAGLDTAFLFGSGTAEISGIAQSTATNGTSITSSQLTTAWSDILTDPSYTLATNSNTSALVVGLGAANGSSAAGSGGFPVAGTLTGTTYSIYLISWSDAYSSPQAAAAAGADVGWSKTFSYTTVTSIGTPETFTTAGFSAFGLATVVPSPEPSTIALAGLGVSALVAFRRRNSSK